MITYQQTDDDARFGVIAACSTLGAVSLAQAKVADQNGTPGSTPALVQEITGSTIIRDSVMFQSRLGSPNRSTWPAGDWIVRLNVTTANARARWIRTRICRSNRGGTSFSTVASVNLGSGGEISLGSTGVKEMTVTQSAESNGGLTDVFYIMLQMRYVPPAGPPIVIFWRFTPDQTITTPFADIIGGPRGTAASQRVADGEGAAPRIEGGATF